MNILGTKIRELREAQSMTQEEFAAKCNVLGWDISRGTLAKIEADRRRLTDKEIILVAKAFDIAPGDLFL